MLRAFATALLSVSLLNAAKRPLNHNDSDSWRHIQNQQLSNDGRYLAYALFPQQGDGEIVVRDLSTGKEIRQAAGELPPPPPPNYANPQIEDAPPQPPGVAIKFSADSKTLIAVTFAPRAELEKAKREKRKPEDMPKGDLIVLDLASSNVLRAPRVKNFQVPTKANGFVAYLEVPEKAATPSKPAGIGSAEISSEKRSKTIEVADLVLRNLRDNTERRFADVSEYTLTKDAQYLVYADSAPASDADGVYVVKPASPSDPTPLLTGKGKYEKLAWDEEQTRLAFVSGRDGAGSSNSKFKLYDCPRGSEKAIELASPETAGMLARWNISDEAPISFSRWQADLLRHRTAKNRAQGRRQHAA